MAWRVAKSLNVLLDQLNSMFPNRSKVSDGSIGDAAHASRSSDHNPWYGPGIVTARDYTHDPADGIDCQWLADTLVASGDRRIKYIIWNHRIWQGSWRPYYGSNAHTQHLHLSVVASPACDYTTPWNLGGGDELDAQERNALFSIYNALFKRADGTVEHGTQGDQSIITRLVEIQGNTRKVNAVLDELDAITLDILNLKGFTYGVGPSLADGPQAGVGPDSIIGRLKALKVSVEELKADS